jgi:hypothetical protein
MYSLSISSLQIYSFFLFLSLFLMLLNCVTKDTLFFLLHTKTRPLRLPVFSVLMIPFNMFEIPSLPFPFPTIFFFSVSHPRSLFCLVCSASILVTSLLFRLLLCFCRWFLFFRRGFVPSYSDNIANRSINIRLISTGHRILLSS